MCLIRYYDLYVIMLCILFCICFFFQAEDGIRDLVRSRGLGDVYKRQRYPPAALAADAPVGPPRDHVAQPGLAVVGIEVSLSLIHI